MGAINIPRPSILNAGPFQYNERLTAVDTANEGTRRRRMSPQQNPKEQI